MDAGSRGTTAHAHQCCRFQGYPKAVPSRMKLTMREPASMTPDKGSRQVTSYFYSALQQISYVALTGWALMWRCDHGISHHSQIDPGLGAWPLISILHGWVVMLQCLKSVTAILGPSCGPITIQHSVQADITGQSIMMLHWAKLMPLIATIFEWCFHIGMPAHCSAPHSG